MLNDNIIVAAISAAGGIVSSYLAYKYNQKRGRRKIDTTFSAIEGYERLLRDQQKEIDRKSATIEKLEEEVARLRDRV